MRRVGLWLVVPLPLSPAPARQSPHGEVSCKRRFWRTRASRQLLRVVVVTGLSVHSRLCRTVDVGRQSADNAAEEANGLGDIRESICSALTSDDRTRIVLACFLYA